MHTSPLESGVGIMIVRDDNYVEFCREEAKRTKDRHDLAFFGKNAGPRRAEIQAKIAQAVSLCPEDDLVDIGCGDGGLLEIASRAGVNSALGLVATEEEASLLRQYGLSVKQGLTHALPLPSSSASVIVCNSVFLVVPPPQIPASLYEIYRVAKPGARIYIGEIPSAPGREPLPQFKRDRDLLLYLYRKQGLRASAGMLRRMVSCWMAHKPLIVRDGAFVSFFATSEEFISLAESSGFELIRYWSHGYMGRNNYLFQKSPTH